MLHIAYDSQDVTAAPWPHMARRDRAANCRREILGGGSDAITMTWTICYLDSAIKTKLLFILAWIQLILRVLQSMNLR